MSFWQLLVFLRSITNFELVRERRKIQRIQTTCVDLSQKLLKSENISFTRGRTNPQAFQWEHTAEWTSSLHPCASAFYYSVGYITTTQGDGGNYGAMSMSQTDVRHSYCFQCVFIILKNHNHHLSPGLLYCLPVANKRFCITAKITIKFMPTVPPADEQF